MPETVDTSEPWSANRQYTEILNVLLEEDATVRRAVKEHVRWSNAYWEGQQACGLNHPHNPYGDVTSRAFEDLDIEYTGWEHGYKAAWDERAKRLAGLDDLSRTKDGVKQARCGRCMQWKPLNQIARTEQFRQTSYATARYVPGEVPKITMRDVPICVECAEKEPI